MKKTFITALFVSMSVSCAFLVKQEFNAAKGQDGELLLENAEALADPIETTDKYGNTVEANGKKEGDPTTFEDDRKPGFIYHYIPCVNGDPSDYCLEDMIEEELPE